MHLPTEILNLVTKITDIQSRQALLTLTIQRCTHADHHARLLKLITKLSDESIEAHTELLARLEIISPSDVIAWPKVI